MTTTLDALLARSRAPGTFVERRTFTLSREKAIAKQREFALRHPRQYLLELVQAAVFAGATYMAIDTRPQSLLVAWVGGSPLLARELENLFDYLFADRGEGRWRHLIQLAIGVNALLQRAPKVLRIESGDGQRAFRMDLDPSGRATLGEPTEPIHGTYLYAEYTVGWFSRFTASAVSEEQHLIEERCLYTPIPILLNGLAPFGYRGSRHIAVFGAKAWEPFDQEGRRGVVAVHASHEGPRGFRMVVGGVWVSTLSLGPLADRALYGVVCDDNLRKTADQSDIVQDRRFYEMLHAVQPIATRLMYRTVGPSYRPPSLPPIPPGDPTDPVQRAPIEARPAPEPLPEPIPMLPPRFPVPLAELAARTDAPLFTVDWNVARDLRGPVASPDQFPWKVLVLTPGQAITLGTTLPGTTIHRLTSKADVDFVRRIVDRRIRVRSVSIDTTSRPTRRPPVAGAVTAPPEPPLAVPTKVTVDLYLEGPLPDWGPGVPFCVTGPRGVLEHGGIDRQYVHARGGSLTGAGRTEGASNATRHLSTPFTLPNLAIRVQASEPTLLEESHLRAALEVAHALAVPDDGSEVHGPLLAELLGTLGVPQLVHTDAGVRAEVALPLGWPLSIRRAPLTPSWSGAPALTLERLEALLGTAEAMEIPDLAALLSLDALERRLGYGHLTHGELEVRPLYGAGRFGERWVWIEDPTLWASPSLEQVVWVGATFAPRQRDQVFTTGIRPAPMLVGATRDGLPAGAEDGPDGYLAGFRALFAGLQRVEAEQRWAAFAGGSVTEGRAEGMGRLALIHLAQWLGLDHAPLLIPTDGGGRRSAAEIREHPAARVVARRGVRLAEAWTFALTRDELAAVAKGGVPRLRYDDRPEVWRSMRDTDHGWLVRHEIHQAGLRGWLGLRDPYDGTAGVLLRTTGELIGLSDLERSVPCHGLLWSEDGSPQLNSEQRRLAQLAGLRLYQELVGILERGAAPSNAEAMAARAYAIPYVLLAWRRGGHIGVDRLSGTAFELARRIEVAHDGVRVGSLDSWLRTPPALRPVIDGITRADTEAELEDAASTVLTDEIAPTTPARPLELRMLDALGLPRMALRITPIVDSGTDVIAWIRPESHRERLVLAVNFEIPAVRRAIEGPGRAREVLLLELMRQAIEFGREHGRSFDLCRAQQLLLAQRFGAD